MGGTRSDSPLFETLVVIMIVYLAQLITGVGGYMDTLFVLRGPVTDEWWTIVTSVYAHQNSLHLISNLLALVLFGWPIARATTRVRFHVFFVSTGAIAGITQVLVTGGGVLGASGAIFALMGYLIAANRISEVLASFVVVPRWATIAVFVGLAVLITWATAGEGIALIAHFTGFLLGLFLGRARVLRPKSRRR